MWMIDRAGTAARGTCGKGRALPAAEKVRGFRRSYKNHRVPGVRRARGSLRPKFAAPRVRRARSSRHPRSSPRPEVHHTPGVGRAPGTFHASGTRTGRGPAVGAAEAANSAVLRPTWPMQTTAAFAPSRAPTGTVALEGGVWAAAAANDGGRSIVTGERSGHRVRAAPKPMRERRKPRTLAAAMHDHASACGCRAPQRQRLLPPLRAQSGRNTARPACSIRRSGWPKAWPSRSARSTVSRSPAITPPRPSSRMMWSA